ncbi:MAG: hypothetical protein KC635_15790, partial [Myxococcales bacterium]|nr:hypothetical protein [Myxococcales bacterium]
MTAIRGALLVVLILVGAGSASAYNLHGPAVCSGTPMVGATIEAIDTTLQTSAGVSVTDGGGEYALSLAAGFYDLAVTPPEGSPCDATVIRNRHVTADELYQIILVMQDPGPNPTITFTGSIVDDLGNPIPEIQVTLSGVGDNYREFRGYSNASGQYAITVEVTSEMTFHLELRSEYNNIPALPQYFNCSGETLTLTGSSIYDITLPFEAIGGHVALNDTGTPPIAGAYVNAYGSGTAGTFSCSSYGGSAATDANGDYGPIYVFGNGSATVGVGAVARSYYGASQVVDTTPVGPSVADFVLEPDATVFAQVSGTITGFGGAPLQGMRLEWESDSGYINATTDAAGHYAVEVPPGDYSRLTIRDDYGGLANAPNQYLNCGNNVTYAFTGVHVVDLDIPVSVVAGHVSVAPDTPAANASINASSSVTVGDIGCSGSSRATADANGDFSGLYVLSGASVTLGSSVPFGGPYSGGTATVTDLVADGSVSGVELVHTPLQTYPVSGTVTGYGGAPVSGLSVRMVGPSGYVSAGTDAAGHYTMNVLPGTYSEIELQYYGGGSSSLQNPQDFSCSSYSTQVEVTGDGEVVQDFALPIRRVTGTVTTSASIPIEGVSMYVNTNGSVGGLGCNGNTNGVVSDENGHYELYVFAGNSNFYFYPPSGSGFLSTSFGSPTPEDLSQQLVLPLPDIVAPTLTGEPVVIHHSNTSVSIQWGTNEATNTRLEYGPGSTLPGAPTVLTKPAYVTDHVVTLTGLDTETQYAFQVTSKDAAGNAVTSGVITFTTLVEADADAPVIVSGPTVTYLAPTQIRVSWQTNEPATSYVDWQVAGSGNVVTSGNGESALLHDVLLTGLSPLTTYSLTVASSDPDGNGPTVEGPLDVTTPDVLDTTPPAVSALRTECVTDTRMAVCWDTSEA